MSLIVGVGVDIVETERFRRALERTPALRDRLFREDELAGLGGESQRLAARFAAKEAVAKALGAPPGMAWHDCAVLIEASGRPFLDVRGTVAAAAAVLGVTDWHVSLSHDGTMSVAYVVAEARP